MKKDFKLHFPAAQQPKYVQLVMLIKNKILHITSTHWYGMHDTSLTKVITNDANSLLSLVKMEEAIGGKTLQRCKKFVMWKFIHS